MKTAPLLPAEHLLFMTESKVTVDAILLSVILNRQAGVKDTAAPEQVQFAMLLILFKIEFFVPVPKVQLYFIPTLLQPDKAVNPFKRADGNSQ